MDDQSTTISDTETYQEELENRVIQPDAQAEQYDYTKEKDLSGIFICQICDRLMEPDQPKSELMCHHTFHTLCCLHYLFDRGPTSCITCGTNVFGNLYEDNQAHHDIHHIINEKRRTKREEKLKRFEKEVMADKELLADLKIVKRSIAEARKASTAFNKFQIVQCREFQTESENLVKIIESMKNERLKRVKQSNEAKIYRSKRARAAFFMRVFERKYPDKSLNALHPIKKLKIPCRWQLHRILYDGFHRRTWWRWRIRI
jgi:hypothetical protein